MTILATIILTVAAYATTQRIVNFVCGQEPEVCRWWRGGEWNPGEVGR